jgi:hypothetical protein
MSFGEQIVEFEVKLLNVAEDEFPNPIGYS